jgi:sugar (pentulose or hexulose) kinase
MDTYQASDYWPGFCKFVRDCVANAAAPVEANTEIGGASIGAGAVPMDNNPATDESSS